MKKYIIIFVLFFPLTCVRNYRSDNCSYNFTINAGNNPAIDKAEIENAISSVFAINQSSTIAVEIIIYSQSSGKEIFSYSDDKQNEITTKSRPGEIEALIKIKNNSILKSVFFIKAEGNYKKEMFQKLAAKLHSTICN
jgi:hypothetical protein